jgi:asparagine synthetase B (glutamine-hydrolysing)
MIRKSLETHIKNNVPDENVALLLSGGVDSITAGLSAYNVGKRVHAYSFFLDSDVSYDFLRATEVAYKMGWKFTPVVVPKTNLIKDWYKLVKLRCRKKTHLS